MVTIYPIYFANTSSFLQNREKDGKIETNKKGVITMKFVIQRVLESAVKELSAQQEQFYMVQQKSGTLRLSIREITYFKSDRRNV